MIRFFILAIVVVLIEAYSFIAIKQAFRSKPLLFVYVVFSIISIGYFIYVLAGFNRVSGQTQQTLITTSLILLYIIPKLFVAIFLFGEDIVRFFEMLYNLVVKQNAFFSGRKRFVSQIALIVAAVPFFSILYGIIQGKYNYKVIHKTVYFENLPDKFDGFKILQLSDIHSGSLNDKLKVEQAIKMINKEDFDVFVFTGDLVNNFASEMDPWIDVFNEIKNPKYGKYSVLGNHDYGEYIRWNSKTEKTKNFEGIKEVNKKIGFKLLLNENVILKNQNDSVAIVGVENWGGNLRFQQLGDLDKASENLNKDVFKILLSHDPSHFDFQVKNHPKNFDLTLSGHTHGFQFGIEILDVFKWSPVQYVYKKWAGLYQDSGKYLYVNRGFGFHAYSGRVGIWPEITVLELKKK